MTPGAVFVVDLPRLQFQAFCILKIPSPPLFTALVLFIKLSVIEWSTVHTHRSNGRRTSIYQTWWVLPWHPLCSQSCTFAWPTNPLQELPAALPPTRALLPPSCLHSLIIPHPRSPSIAQLLSKSPPRRAKGNEKSQTGQFSILFNE